jgi:hypothetical protein
LESQQAFTLGSFEEGGGEIQDGDDKAWWDEVVSTVANMECASQVPMSYTQSQISSDTTELSMEDDEEWWDAVERETQELERSTISRTSGWPS